ncbi:hypothetical protein ACO1O0_002260 [Amphichorda felina]
MASPADYPGDVINLVSSSDESAAPKKRSRTESENSQGSDSSVRRSKRARKNPETLAKTPDNSVGTEEGEVDDEPRQGQPLQAQPDSKDTTSQQPEGEGAAQAPSLGVFIPPKAPIYKHKSGSAWVEFKLPVYSSKREGTWDDRFSDWAQIFCTGNVDQAGYISSSVVLAAYNYYLENNSGIKGKKKKNAKQAAKAFMEAGNLKATLKSSLPRNAKSTKQNPQSALSTGNEAPQTEGEYDPTIEEPQTRETGAVPSARTSQILSFGHKPD